VVTIPYGRQTIEQDDLDAVRTVLSGDWLTQGPSVARFEDEVAASCAVPYAVAFSSGTAALHAAAAAAEVGPGDELLTSAMTFAASANCGAYLGATPRFADVDPVTVNVTPETVLNAVTERTRAVVIVHFAGLPAPTAAIRRALPPGTALIEDAAHALGATDASGPIGSCHHSDMSVFSFHPVKAIATGEGGMVTTRSSELRDRLRQFRNHGMTKDPKELTRDEGDWYQEQHVLGFNYRLTDIQSALGSSQLAKLERFVTRRNELADRYRYLLSKNDAIQLPCPAGPEIRHAYHLFAIRLRGGSRVRRRVYDGLRAQGILAQVHYMPVYWHPYYANRFGYREGLCPIAERYYSECLSLPMFPALTDAEQDVVVAALADLT
jgi:perosamine synthetase